MAILLLDSMGLKELLRSKTVRNGTAFSIYSFFNKGTSFLLLLILANYIQPKEYGELSIFNTVVMILGYVVSLSVHSYLSVSYFQRSKEDFRKDFSAICIITIIASFILFVVLALDIDWWSGVLKIPVDLVLFPLLLATLNVFVHMNTDLLRVQERIKEYGVFSCCFAISNMLLTLYLVICQEQNWRGFIYAKLLCDCLFGLISLFRFYKFKLFTITKDFNIYKTLLLFGLPVIPHHLANWIRQGCDRYIIDYFYDTTEVGLYSFALNLVSIITMIGTAFNATNSVNIYKTLSADFSSTEKKAKLKRIERYIALLYLCFTILIVVGSVVFVPILLPKYSSCVTYFLILSVSGLMICLYFLKCNYLFYFKRTKTLMYITFGTSIIHLTLSLLLTRYSLFYTCIIYSTMYFIMFLLTSIQANKLLTKEI